MTKQELVAQIRLKQSYLCVGLDTDISQLPPHLLDEEDPVFSFNKAIIDATRDYCVAYKINTAFYEAMGVAGWRAMEKTLEYIPKEIFTIADAKRGDIGNTALRYAQAFFKALSFDAVTVAPYMGEDSVTPFLGFAGKWAIVLGLTSNKGAADFELQKMASPDGKSTYLYEKVIATVSSWGTEENIMFVAGATQAEQFAQIRQIVPEHFLLVPGVGAQGGSLQEISAKGMTEDVGLLVNASRAIIYASKGTDFAKKSAEIAAQYRDEMKALLHQYSPGTAQKKA
jgi:orotidine-5'-phosphate decarboxylase